MSHGDWYASDNPERYCIGPHKTKEEAIKEFKEENEGKEPTHIGQANEVFAEIYGYRVIEELANGSLYEEVYEDALSGWCNFKINDPKWDVLSERLTKVLHEWLDEVGERKSWDVVEQIK